MSTENDETIKIIIDTYRHIINNTPALLSLLYDADLLPEQITSSRAALSMAAVVEAYKLGKETK